MFCLPPEGGLSIPLNNRGDVSEIYNSVSSSEGSETAVFCSPPEEGVATPLNNRSNENEI